MNVRQLRIVAVGDLSFNGRYHQLLSRHGVGYPFAAVSPLWQDADLRLGNLESPLTDAPRFSPAKFTLRGAAATIESLRSAGFDCMSLANNHAMDYGPEGLLETCRHLRSNELPFVGAGDCDDTAAAPIVIVRNGLRIGCLAFCDVEQSSPLYAGPRTAGVAALNISSSMARVRELRSSVDWLIVQLHWGVEMSQLPSPKQRELARKFVDAGADLILGHHPHVLQPFEVIDGVPVAYSLGNFLFSEMYSRGVNTKGQQFCAKLRLHPLSRLTGWLDVVLTRGQPPQVHLSPCLLRPDLVVVPDAGRNMNELFAMLNRDNYAEAYKRECDRAQARTAWRWDCKPLMRRVEMKLFSLGLLPGAFEGT